MQVRVNNNLLCAKKIYCRKQTFVSKKAIHILPFDIVDKECVKLFSYFLHEAPNISSSHSYSVLLKRQEELMRKMFASRRFVISEFCSPNCKIEKHLSIAGLLGDNLCLNCKRFVCKRKRTEKGKQETEFDCLLRHLRNSIAHGNVYYYHRGNKICLLFEDYNEKTLSARIVCYRADLKHWYEVLQEAKKGEK